MVFAVVKNTDIWETKRDRTMVYWAFFVNLDLRNHLVKFDSITITGHPIYPSLRNKSVCVLHKK